MQTDYTISVAKEDPTTSFLENGFLKCRVTQVNAPFDSRCFIYCLHCCKLGSPSWFDYHKAGFVFDRSERSLTKHRSNYSRYVEDISSDVDLLNDQGKLFKRARKSPPSMTGPQIGSHEHPIIAPCRRLEPSCFTSRCGCDAVEEDLNQDGQAECEESDVFHRTVECVTECFDRFCFLNGNFDHSSFQSLSQTFFSSNTLTECFSDKSFSLFKGRFLSFIIRKVFVLLALSKHQMDTLNHRVKAILSFVSDENETLC